MKKFTQTLTQIFTIASLFLFIGCGGSGSDDEAPSDDSLTWTQNVFENASQFKNFCQAPRSGSDSNGTPYPDKQGSSLHENYWLRSWSNNTYLWYDEITDVNPSGFSSPLDYFSILRTTALTQSGTAKDQFHFTYDTDVWQQLTQSGISAGYGADFTILSSTPPRKIVVAYTEENSPATADGVNLLRGTEIITVDGVDVINSSDQTSVNTLNAGLFPEDVGEEHVFIVRDVGSNENRTITMTSAAVTTRPVNLTTTIDTDAGKVGYLLFNTHIATAEQALLGAVNQLAQAQIDELVLDLRYNGGGLLAIASQLSYMIAGSTATQNKVFDKTIFNDKHPSINPVTGEALIPTPFIDETLGFSANPGQALPALNLSRIFILSTGGTCSASEAIINGLRGVDVEVVLIGSTTCGKPYGFYPTDNCGTTYFTVQFKGENDKGFGDYSDGFTPMNSTGTVGSLVPGCSVADDFSLPLGNPEEAQLAAAINYMQTDSCPSPTGQSKSTNSQKNYKFSAGELAVQNPKKLMLKINGVPTKQ